MNVKKYLVIGALGLAAGASVFAIAATSKTFRTTGIFIGVAQGHDQVTGNPQFDEITFVGHNLVNLAMGRSATDTNVPNQVMAMTINCDLSSASLVVYDRSTSNIVATIAESGKIDFVKQQDTQQTAPNRARFVTTFSVDNVGNGSNGLQGGYLTVAGHVRLDPATGCPVPVLIGLDRDPLDRLVGDREISGKADPDSERFIRRTGLAHLIGVVDVVNNGATNTVLIPYGGLSIRRDLPTILE